MSRNKCSNVLAEYVWSPQTNCLLSSTVMLPCRLFRNTGLPPLLRIPSPVFPSPLKLRLYFRLSVAAHTSRSRYSTVASDAPSSSVSTERGTQGAEGHTVFKQILGKIEPKLSITFTCTVEGCGERSTHQFTRHSYEKGIVLVQCPGCKNRCVYLQLRTVRANLHYIGISLRTTSAGSRNQQRAICVQSRTF